MKKMYIVLAWATVMILGSSGASAYSASADESIADDSVIGGAFADESVVTPSNNCVDVQFIFARGSGATRHESDEWKAFESNARKLAERRKLSYRIIDLEYSAVSVTVPTTAVGAYFSGGKAFKFGRSVRDGVAKLSSYRSMVAMNCPNTRWVLVGYSQGAMVMSQSIKYFKPDEIIYVSLVGDPELYLPEGWGLFPSACFDGDLSRYRVNVPNCRTKRGSLGYRKPYELAGFEGKYGLWCNNDDYICGSSRNLLNNGGHLRYGSDKTFSWIFKIVDSKIVASSRKRRAQLAPASTKDFTQEIVDLKNVEIMAPKIVKVFKKGLILLINLSENEKPAEAKYYLISINSFPVALVDAKEKILTISDIEFDELVSVVISYVDSGMNVGDEAVITLRDDNGVLKLEEYIEEDIGDIGSFEKEFEVLDEPKKLSDILDEIDAEKNVENIGGIAIKEQQYGDMAVDSRKRDFVAVSGMGGRENISSSEAEENILYSKNGGKSIKKENEDSFGWNILLLCSGLALAVVIIFKFFVF